MPQKLTQFLIFLCPIFHVFAFIYEPNLPYIKKESQCLSKYLAVINRFCTYPQTNWPCLNGTEIIDGVVKHSTPLEDIATNCCFEKCSIEDIATNYCCSTPECIENCYNLRVPNDLRKDIYYFG